MKKGDYAPRVRSRWVKGWYPHYTDYQLPVWCYPYDFIAVIVVEILGLPFPTEVIAENCDYACWRYVPTLGAVVWRAPFNNGLITGEWTLQQQIDNENQSYNRFSLTHDDGLANPRVIFDSAGENVGGDWDGAHPRNPKTIHRLPGVTPWVGCTEPTFQYATYSQLRAASIDPDDTRPITWDDPGGP